MVYNDSSANGQNDDEFVMHICRVLDKGVSEGCGVQMNLSANGHDRIRLELREVFWIRAEDAMNWILACVVGDMEFDQERDDEIPLLCRYYNDFIGEGGWREHERACMLVLNRYGKMKASGYGNFGWGRVLSCGWL
jgi:hypothetical protein